MGVINPVDLHEVLQQHEDEVGEKACLFAEVCVLEEIKYLRRQSLEVLIILQNVRNVQVSDLVAETSPRLGQNIGLFAGVHVVLDVNRVLL